jgi:hypothetical protein
MLDVTWRRADGGTFESKAVQVFHVVRVLLKVTDKGHYDWVECGGCGGCGLAGSVLPRERRVTTNPLPRRAALAHGAPNESHPRPITRPAGPTQLKRTPRMADLRSMGGRSRPSVGRLVTISALAATLLVPSCGDDGGDITDVGISGGTTGTTRTREASGAAERVWRASVDSYVQASIDYDKYYHGEYRDPPPWGIDTDEEQIVYITEIHRRLMTRLTALADAHDGLASAFDNAIDKGAISPGEVPDTRDFVDLTGEWIAWQTKVAEGSLDCLESGPQLLAQVQVCLLELAADQPRSDSDQLAAKVEQLASQLFGRQLFPLS